VCCRICNKIAQTLAKFGSQTEEDCIGWGWCSPRLCICFTWQRCCCALWVMEFHLKIKNVSRDVVGALVSQSRVVPTTQSPDIIQSRQADKKIWQECGRSSYLTQASSSAHYIINRWCQLKITMGSPENVKSMS
jgi:hypothetical protein